MHRHRHTDSMHTATVYTIPAGVIVGGIALAFFCLGTCQCVCAMFGSALANISSITHI